MTRRCKAYTKCQTKWVRRPAMITAHRNRPASAVCITLYGEGPLAAAPKPPVSIWMTPQETHAFAAWLCEQADALIASEARKEARRQERMAAKAKPAGDDGQPDGE